MRPRNGGLAAARALAATVLAAALVAGCASSGSAADDGAPAAPGSTPVGTVTKTLTSTAPPTTISGETLTITQTPTEPTTVAPPPTTEEPTPVSGECPYLSNAQVADANGQRAGKTSIIALDPYPVCFFTRADGHFLAAVRIITADTPEEAVAAVNQHVPVASSDPVNKPAGWEGGAMGQLTGIDGFPEARSIYGVSRENIAIIAISNQAQSVKGRQMVNHIVANLGW